MTFSKGGYVTYSDEIEVVNGTTENNILLESNQECTLTGRLTIADEDMNLSNNLPIEAVKISIEKISGNTEIKKIAYSDADGLYEFQQLIPGTYQIIIEKEGYITITQTVTLKKDQPNYYNAMVEVIANQLIGLGSATGRIKDVLTGVGVEGLTLKLRSGLNNTSKGEILAEYTTNLNGDYQTGLLPAGYYCIQIVDERQLENEADCYLSNMINIKILGNHDIGPQNGTVTTGIESDQVRIVLQWGEKPKDLDSHLIVPKSNGGDFHIFYLARKYTEDSRVMAELDLDMTNSYGPETTTIYQPIAGKYTFYIRNYTAADEQELKNSGAYVQVYLGSSLEPMYIFHVPQQDGMYWTVFEYDSQSKSVTPINKVEENEPVIR